jgi:hypothetical protein
MGEQCLADELRTLFLFEHLSELQLGILCADGRVETLPPGPLFAEGEPATTFYVLIDGELVMSAGPAASTSRPAAPRNAVRTAAHGTPTCRSPSTSTTCPSG